MSKKEVFIICPACEGFGLTLSEDQSFYCACASCEGTGKETLTYTPFTGRKEPREHKEVYVPRTKTKIPYKKFKKERDPSKYFRQGK